VITVTSPAVITEGTSTSAWLPVTSPARRIAYLITKRSLIYAGLLTVCSAPVEFTGRSMGVSYLLVAQDYGQI
jgi:hypothetical protein